MATLHQESLHNRYSWEGTYVHMSVYTSSKTVCDDEKLCAIQRCLGIQLQDQAWDSESTQ